MPSWAPSTDPRTLAELTGRGIDPNQMPAIVGDSGIDSMDAYRAFIKNQYESSGARERLARGIGSEFKFSSNDFNAPGGMGLPEVRFRHHDDPAEISGQKPWTPRTPEEQAYQDQYLRHSWSTMRADDATRWIRNLTYLGGAITTLGGGYAALPAAGAGGGAAAGGAAAGGAGSAGAAGGLGAGIASGFTSGALSGVGAAGGAGFGAAGAAGLGAATAGGAAAGAGGAGGAGGGVGSAGSGAGQMNWMDWVGPLISAGSSIIGGNAAADAAAAGSREAIGESRRQFDLVRADTAPVRALGASAVERLMKLYGAGGNSPDMSQFFTSPDYQFNLTEGQNAIDRSAAARGGLLSGAAVKAGQRYASGLASREYGSFVDRLLQQAGVGNTGIGASAAAGANAAGNIGQAAMNAGNARAGIYNNTAANVNNAVQTGMSNYLLRRYLGT